MISKDKTYRTRDGRDVRIYATDGDGRYPVHGARRERGYWQLYSWTEDGKADLADEHDSDCDLVEVKAHLDALNATNSALERQHGKTV